jgi:hypothetical protein
MPKGASGTQRVGDILQRDIPWMQQNSGTAITVPTRLKKKYIHPSDE